MAGDEPIAASEAWAAGAAYDPYIGRWSRRVARAFVEWLAVPPAAAWLDVGCGTAALTATVLEDAAPRAVVGLDRSQAFVSFARDRVARASFAVADAMAIPLVAGSHDAVVSALVVNFVSDPGLMVAEMARVARPGGVVALYVWDYAGRMELLRRFWDAAAALDPAARDLDEGRRFPLCAARPLEELLGRAGLEAVTVRPIDVETRFADFDDLWSPFLGGQGPAPGYVSALGEERRGGLRERLRAGMPFAADGSITLTARAWAVRGTASPRHTGRSGTFQGC